MAAITPVTICNSALIKVGAGTIASLTDQSKEARICNQQYERVRDRLLGAHPWNFAITRKSLAEVTTYTIPFEFENAFQIPTDALRILSTSLNQGSQIGEKHWSVEIDPDTNNKLLLCNDSVVEIKYIKSVPEAFFTPMFAELLSLKIAHEISYALTQSASLKDQLAREFKEEVKNIRSYDGAEGSVRAVEADDWLLARLIGGPGFYTLD